ncbi:MAG: hypothetical protein E6Q40_03840, partial [Cupriavidus sp.]
MASASFTALQPPPALAPAPFAPTVNVTQASLLTALMEVGYGPATNFAGVLTLPPLDLLAFAAYLQTRATALASAVTFSNGEIYWPSWSPMVESSELNTHSYFYGMAGAYIATTTWLPGAQPLHISTFSANQLVQVGKRIATTAGASNQQPDLFVVTPTGQWHLVEGKGRSYAPKSSGAGTSVVVKALSQLNAVTHI